MESAPIAYLVNQYPKVSHSFIRREILALERLGLPVLRLAVRGWDDITPDDQDCQEKLKTRYLLEGGVAPLLLDAAITCLLRPLDFWRGLSLSIKVGLKSDKSMPYHLMYLMEACRLLRWCNGSKVQHVHAHFGTNPAEVAMLCHAMGGPPYSFTVHGPEEFDRPQSLSLGTKARHSAFVVAISSFGRSQLYRWMDHPSWSKVKVIHCGLEKSFHAAPLTPPPRNHRLVCVGRLCEQKGQLLLVQATRLVIDAGLKVDLVLAGDGEMRPDIESEIARLNLKEHIRITGWISSDQVREEILSSRALILPSFAEGLPVVIMEAMSLGRPVISTRVAGISELVASDKVGWLCAAGDIPQLVEAMKTCLQATSETLDMMGREAKLRVCERHDIDTEARKLAALFRPGTHKVQGG